MTICGAARRAGVQQVVVPRTAAVFSAFGIGFSDVSQHYEHPLPSNDAATINAIADRLRERARRDMFAEGVAKSIGEMERAVAGGIGEEDRELLATGTSHDVSGARGLIEQGARFPQHRVANDVSAAVVDRLEMIEVERQQGELAPRA